MASIFTSAIKNYEELMEKADPRVEDYPLMSTPIPGIFLTILYVYIVRYAGPKFMENRKPYDLRKVMVVYNFAMVALSAHMFMEFGMSGWFMGYSLGCQTVDYSRSPQALRMVRVCWLFFFSKFVEFLDTIFFILRKKDNQVTFLHVLHHGIMPLSWWAGVKFVPGGLGTFHGLLNSFIHFWMYSYYGLAAMGPHMQKYLWWKKYMTKLQIVQFILVCTHAGQLLFIECNYPFLFPILIVSYALVFLIMFADFYIKSYKKNAVKSKTNGKKAGDHQESNGYKKD